MGGNQQIANPEQNIFERFKEAIDGSSSGFAFDVAILALDDSARGLGSRLVADSQPSQVDETRQFTPRRR
jgi:hypothetical protein